MQKLVYKAVKAVLLCCALLLFNMADAQVTANFAANQTVGCPPLVVNFSDLSSGNPTSWLWNFGNTNSSVVQNPSAVYTTPGTYTVTLIVADSTSEDTLVQTAFIEVLSGPIVDISVSETQGCVPFTVQFTNLTNAPAGISNMVWDFGDGNFSAASNPQHTYNGADTMTVTLSVTDALGCTTTETWYHLIDVDDVTAAFDMDSLYCNLPATVPFTNQSVGQGLAYAWDFGTSSSTDENPSPVFSQFDTIPVQLIATNPYGCADTVSHQLLLTEYQADFTYSVQCSPAGLTMFHSPSANLQQQAWLWTFDDGVTSGQVSPSHTLPGYGPYTTTLVSQGVGNCFDTVSHTYEPPTANFGADYYFCEEPFLATFADSSTGSGNLFHFWQFGDNSSGFGPNITHTYDVPDTIEFRMYGAQLIVENEWGCRDTLVKSIQFWRPIVNFNTSVDDTYNGGCVPLTVNFYDSTITGTPITDWFWDFGNGQTSALQNPLITYPDTGIFDVSLTITTAAGCTDSLVVPSRILVGLKPDSVWVNVHEDICTPKFDAESFIAFPDSIANVDWLWPFYSELGHYHPDADRIDTNMVFDDANFFAATQPIEDTTDLVLYVLGGHNSCLDTGFFTVHMEPNVERSFSYDPCKTYFVDTIGVPIELYDSLMFTTQDVCDSLGQFTAAQLSAMGIDSLLLDSACGICTSNLFEVSSCGTGIWLPPIPILPTQQLLQYDFFNVTAGTLVDTVPPGSEGLYFSNPGVYFMATRIRDTSIVVTDSNLIGCDIILDTLMIRIDSAEHGFATQVGSSCLQNNVFSFLDTSYTLVGELFSIEWDFGDGNTLETGYKVVSNGITNSSYNVEPQDSIIPSDVNNGQTSGTYRNPSHIYLDTGTYVVTSLIRNQIGVGGWSPINQQNLICWYYSTDTIRVENVYPAVSATSQSICRDSALQLFNNSISTSPIVYQQWKITGAGFLHIDTAQSPQVTIDTLGLFNVELIAINEAGCSDTITVFNFAETTWPTATGYTGSSLLCKGDSQAFISTSFGAAPLIHTWDFGNGETSNQNNVWYTYPQSGQYNVTLSVSDVNGCTEIVDVESMNIAPVPIANFAADTINTPCPPLPVVFGDSSSGQLEEWHWNFGDGSGSVNQHPFHTYTSSGLYDVTLEVVTNFGCRDTIVRTNYVEVGGPAGSFYLDPDSVCAPLPVQFNYTLTNTDSTTWDWGDGFVETIPVLGQSGSFTHVYDEPGTFQPALVLEDPDGCEWTVPSNLTVFVDKVEANFIASDTLLCDTTRVFFSDASDWVFPSTVQWTFHDGTTSPSSFPSFYYDSLGHYPVVLTVTGPFCSDTANKTIVVSQEPTILIEPSAFHACVPEGVEFGGHNLNPEAEVDYWQWLINGQTQQTGDLVDLWFDSLGWQVVTLRAHYADSACYTDTTFTLFGTPTPTADFDHTPKLPSVQEAEITFADQSQHASAWHWEFYEAGTSENQNPVIRYEYGGIFPVTLVAEDNFECADTITKLITIIPRMANVFTPNGDGLNDTYYVMEPLDFTQFELTIYNRWGQELYFTNSYENGWDGYWDGQQVPDGVYYWDLWFNFNSNPGEPYHLKGFVHLYWGPEMQPPTKWIWEKKN